MIARNAYAYVAVAVAALVLAKSCSVEHDLAELQVQKEQADAALEVSLARLDSLETVRAAHARADSMASARFAAEIEAWRARAAEAERVAAQASERAEDAAERFLAVADSQAVALFEEYQAEVAVELVAWQNKARDTEHRLDAALTVIDRKDALIARMVDEIDAKDAAITAAVQSLAVQEAITARYRRRGILVTTVAGLLAGKALHEWAMK